MGKKQSYFASDIALQLEKLVMGRKDRAVLLLACERHDDKSDEHTMLWSGDEDMLYQFMMILLTDKQDGQFFRELMIDALEATENNGIGQINMN